jgi:hypothetical protein
LGGGGVGPAQFFGKTHDGRDVYGRYRWGVLSVEMDPDGDVPETLLDVQVGPPLHAEMSLGQFCKITGITHNGTAPPLPDFSKKHGFKDLSGATSFLSVKDDRLTRDEICDVLTRLRSVLPNAAFLEFVIDDAREIIGVEVVASTGLPSRSHSVLVVGEKAAGKKIKAWETSKTLASLFPGAMIVQLQHFDLEEGNVFPLKGLSVSADFATAHAAHRAWAEKIIEVVRK